MTVETAICSGLDQIIDHAPPPARPALKLYALHAPEVGCVGKGNKASPPYEFGCKVSIATPVASPRGGQFVLRTRALHGNPKTTTLWDRWPRRLGISRASSHVDKSYRGHNYSIRFNVWMSG